MIIMGITDYIKTRLLNNRVEQYTPSAAIGVKMKGSQELTASTLALTCPMHFHQLLIKQ